MAYKLVAKAFQPFVNGNVNSKSGQFVVYVLSMTWGKSFGAKKVEKCSSSFGLVFAEVDP